jgi:type II secretory pathway pseudopilin PulG
VNTLEIVILVVLAILGLLALGGAVAQRRRLRATEAQFRAQVEQANQDLAEAHAADNGWEPARVEEAARRAFAERHPGAEITSMALVQVIDKPGTDEDKAVFRVESPQGEHTVVLGRTGDQWVAEAA